MAKTSQLTEASSVDSSDLLAISDISTGQSKKITVLNFIRSVVGGVQSRNIDISVADQTARDALTPFEGMQIFREDTDAFEVYDGSAWLTFDTKWQTYTPVFYTNGTAYTLGNGTVSGKYFRTGKKCSVKVRLLMGSSTTWSGATGSHELSLPFNSNYTAGIDLNTPLGSWQAYNSAVASTNGNVELSATTSRVFLMYFKYGDTANDRAAISNTAPFTSAVGDAQAGQFEYEMA